ncbi:hypothetical protein GS682_17605 [Nostoc sp. B(2019)]|nr:hypothetical protein [Nostoc sp. B(2019)]
MLKSRGKLHCISYPAGTKGNSMTKYYLWQLGIKSDRSVSLSNVLAIA